MITYRCSILQRDYTQWYFDPPLNNIEPLQNHLFDQDVIRFDETTRCVTIHQSLTRKSANIPGILLLENNRTYGRTANKKRLYYKFCPYDAKLPYFLVPFDITMGFNKNFKNKYCTIQFDHWNDKHPYGKLSQNIGDVYDYHSYCEYILYCKQLHHPITPSITRLKQLLRTNPAEYYQEKILSLTDEYGNFQHRTNKKEECIFTVDPPGCKDRDDAISIVLIDSDNNGVNTYRVSIFIANVWVWLHALDLWSYIGQRISTIYFPHTKRSMLPTAMGEELCSLEKDQRKFGFVLDFVVRERPGQDVKIDFEEMDSSMSLRQCVLNVSENYDYEEPSLLKNKHYKLLRKLSKELDSNIQDSHEVVAYWMLQMNQYCAKQMREKQFGIFRIVQSKRPKQEPAVIIEQSSNQKIPSFIKLLEQQLTGSYVSFSPDLVLDHESLCLSEYVHFTSPIRRMVDLVNQMLWVKYVVQPTDLDIHGAFMAFYTTQLSELPKLNNDMKKICRIQSECIILHKTSNDESILNRQYEGMIVSVFENKCSVYMEELGWMTQLFIDPDTFRYRKYDRIQCKLYVFEREEQMRKKIRIQLLE